MVNKYLTPTQQGIAAMVFGFVLLFYSLGVFVAGLTFLIVAISIAFIVYGFIQSGLYDKAVVIIKRKKK